MKSLRQIWLRARLSAASLMRDRRGIAATEFAFIVPIMLVMFFGTVEFSSGIAVDRKVTLMARTLADLTSQSVSVANSDLTNFFSASNGIMTPYDGTPTKATISELYVDPKTLQMAKAGITLHDVAYARPRQSLCVFYPTTNPLPANCPML